MFDIGWGELMLIGMVALIAIGPKELPGALRTLGQWMTKIRRMASEFQGQFHEAMREAELHELRKEVDEMAAKAADYTNFDPIGDIRKDIEKAADLPDLDAPKFETPKFDTSNSPEPHSPEPAISEPAAAAADAPAANLPAATGEGGADQVSLPPSDAALAVDPTPGGVGKPDAGKAA